MAKGLGEFRLAQETCDSHLLGDKLCPKIRRLEVNKLCHQMKLSGDHSRVRSFGSIEVSERDSVSIICVLILLMRIISESWWWKRFRSPKRSVLKAPDVAVSPRKCYWVLSSWKLQNVHQSLLRLPAPAEIRNRYTPYMWQSLRHSAKPNLPSFHPNQHYLQNNIGCK